MGTTCRFSQTVLLDATPMPEDIPAVKEIGATSAPLMSASFFIGARCRPYNDDFMQCKTESYGKGEVDCLREGRKVTRCAASVLQDINTHCLEEFRTHYNCLEQHNQQQWQCRRPERVLNRCVFQKIVRSLPYHPDLPLTPRRASRKPFLTPLPTLPPCT